MRVAIITFVRAYNYGAALQAYALNKIINDLGADCKVIDYYPACFRDEYSLKHYGSFILKPNKHIRTWFRNNVVYFKVKERTKRFERFISKLIELTETQYRNYDEIQSCTEFDIFISGSDQVWCPYLCEFDKVFYLSFCDKEKRYSYAASFGVDDIPEDLIEEYKKRLSNWKKYSVRELSGIDIIKRITGEDAICCCDPTLLLSKDQWNRVINRKTKKDYILLYFVNESKNLFDYVKTLSKEKELEVICLHSNMQPKYFSSFLSRNYGFKCFSDASPFDFIRLIRDAKYVITNSFHGTVFSIVFHKQFLVQNILDDGRINNRINQLLSDLNIVNRSINKITDIEVLDKKMNWEKIDNSLYAIKLESMNYLNSILNHD